MEHLGAIQVAETEVVGDGVGVEERSLIEVSLQASLKHKPIRIKTTVGTKGVLRSVTFFYPFPPAARIS